VYTTLREAEYRSTYPIAYWKVPPLRWLVPRQRRNDEALAVIQRTLDELIAKCKRLVEEEDEEFVEEFLSKADPSILHFLIASGARRPTLRAQRKGPRPPATRALSRLAGCGCAGFPKLKPTWRAAA
jgi:hypothetical protein